MSIIKSFFKTLSACIRYINTYFKTFVLLFIILLIFILQGKDEKGIENLQKIYINGAILDSTTLVNQIYEVMEDDNIKGVLLDINSPGGAAGASMEIALAIKELKEKKPVIAYAREYMASGSYLAGSSATYIMANPISIIGSIGVLISSVDISEALKKLGIKPQSLSAGKYKEILNFSKPLKDEDKAYIQEHINDVYDVFTSFVAEQRKLDMNKIQTWADARIFIANEALKVGLIDELGSIKKAEDKLKELSKVNEAIWKDEKPSTTDFLDKLSTNLSKEIMESLLNLFYF
ncbi:signal peptide peptidase SppA [uncultured Campylobacter sp.]|uniref:signal peptide peptidase SppA n=1 Tax=uncultured Campylobacter sp. TaxID=218934 RepID=UPI0026157EB8|nr:signal peptide peptidase SppA [uncultured Campylobacter sp.]